MDAFLLSSDRFSQLAEQLGVGVGVVTVGILFLVVWSLVWKGLALWTAARNYQRGWFVAMIVVNNTAGLLEIAYLLWFRRDRRPGVTQSLFEGAPVTSHSAKQAGSSE